MKVLRGPYFSFNHKILCITGQWPTLTNTQKWIRSYITTILLVSLLIPMIFGLIEVIKIGNLNVVAESFSPLFVTILTIVLHINFTINNRQLSELLEKIQRDWELWSTEPEIEILKQHAAKDRRFRNIYGSLIIGAASGFLAIPVAHNFLNWTNLVNETSTQTSVFLTDYGVNEGILYHLATFHSIILTYVAMIVIVNADTVFMICNQHASSIYAAIGNKLSNLDYNKSHWPYKGYNAQSEMDQIIIFCAKQHEEILRFLKDVHNCFSTVFLLIVATNMLIISVSGFATVLNLNHPSVAFRFMAANCGQMVHILCLTAPCEQMRDQSSFISHSVYKSDWYRFPVSSQRLLLMIMKKSSEPCEFVCGKLYTFSMKNFAMVMKTSISYFTVLCSFRG